MLRSHVEDHAASAAFQRLNLLYIREDVAS